MPAQVVFREKPLRSQCYRCRFEAPFPSKNLIGFNVKIINFLLNKDDHLWVRTVFVLYYVQLLSIKFGLKKERCLCLTFLLRSCRTGLEHVYPNFWFIFIRNISIVELPILKTHILLVAMYSIYITKVKKRKKLYLPKWFFICVTA